MAPHRKKDLQAGGRGYGYEPGDEQFLQPDSPSGSWRSDYSGASESGTYQSRRWDDNTGHFRGSNWDDSESHGLVNKFSDEHQEVAHQRLASLIDGQDDQPAGKLLGGGGPVSENADDNSPGWKGSGRKGPKYAPKTGPQTNMTGWKK
jgi:hypothetical protein